MTDHERLQRIESRLAEIEPWIQHLRKQKNRDWGLFNDLMDERQRLEQDKDEIVLAEQRQQDLQEISDWYDDEKNRDAYTMAIIDLEFSEIAS